MKRLEIPAKYKFVLPALTVGIISGSLVYHTLKYDLDNAKSYNKETMNLGYRDGYIAENCQEASIVGKTLFFKSKICFAYNFSHGTAEIHQEKQAELLGYNFPTDNKYKKRTLEELPLSSVAGYFATLQNAVSYFTAEDAADQSLATRFLFESMSPLIRNELNNIREYDGYLNDTEIEYKKATPSPSPHGMKHDRKGNIIEIEI